MNGLLDAGPLLRGRVKGMAVTVAPSVGFVIANAISSLRVAIAIALIIAAIAFAWQVSQHDSLWHAVIGLMVVTACAAVAASTGQARGFFLLPMLVPLAVVTASIASLLAGRPLTGLLLNRISGGPADWPDVPRLRRVYVLTTVASAAFQAVSAALQVALYEANQTIALAGLHVLAGPVSAVIVAATIIGARRGMRIEALEQRSRTI